MDNFKNYRNAFLVPGTGIKAFQKVIFSTALMLVLSGTCNFLAAQDIHFSQFYNTPLILNPAQTGKVHGTFRVMFNYRNQWPGVVSGRSSYSTPAASVDVPIRFKSKDILGVGVYFVNDNSGGGKLKYLTTMLSVAFHKVLGEKKTHFISLGAQVGYSQRKLDPSIKLGDQIDLQNEITVASADQLAGSKGGVDLNVGIHWSSQFNNRFGMSLGYAMYHAIEPSQTFFMNGLQSGKVPRRNIVHFDTDIRLAKRLVLHPALLFMLQDKSNQANAGVTFIIDITDNALFELGAYYRIKDAVIPYVGFTARGFQVGLSYDMTTSSLKNTNGSIELSVSYTGKYVPVPNVKPSLYCPRF